LGLCVLGAVGVVLRKVLLFVGAGLLVYSVGGWSALSAAWKVIWGSQP